MSRRLRITPDNVAAIVRAEAERDVAFLQAFTRLRESTYQVPMSTTLSWWRMPVPWRVVHWQGASLCHPDCAPFFVPYHVRKARERARDERHAESQGGFPR